MPNVIRNKPKSPAKVNPNLLPDHSPNKGGAKNKSPAKGNKGKGKK